MMLVVRLRDLSMPFTAVLSEDVERSMHDNQRGAKSM
jgi:hypothetical protein